MGGSGLSVTANAAKKKNWKIFIIYFSKVHTEPEKSRMWLLKVKLKVPNHPFQPLWQNNVLWIRVRQVYGIEEKSKGRQKLELTNYSDKTSNLKN